ncbi:hypothetical protein DFQ30_004695 [Apophysomyces sp. BC1015]|nr:hypothetical protein DFQ30_004695 [Apophysomyces sp. BC1015]
MDVGKCKDTETQVRQLPEAVQKEINEFVCRQRNDLENILRNKIGHIVDLFDCLGATRTISKTSQTTSTDTSSKRKRAHMHEENETHEDEDEKIAQGNALLPLLISFLDKIGKNLLFSRLTWMDLEVIVDMGHRHRWTGD